MAANIVLLALILILMAMEVVQVDGAPLQLLSRSKRAAEVIDINADTSIDETIDNMDPTVGNQSPKRGQRRRRNAAGLFLAGLVRLCQRHPHMCAESNIEHRRSFKDGRWGHDRIVVTTS